MSKSAEDIVISAFRQFAGKSTNETLTADEMSVGIDFLSDIISSFDDGGLLIPFDKKIDFELIANINEYVFTNELAPIGPPVSQVFIGSEPIVYINFLNITFGSSKIPIRVISKQEFYGNFRTDNRSMPFEAFLDKQLNRAIITFYPTPNINYNVTFQGKVELSDLQRFSNITQFSSSNYKYLRYAVGKELTRMYRIIPWTADMEKDLSQMESDIKSSNPIEMGLNSYNIVGNRSYPGYWEYGGLFIT